MKINHKQTNKRSASSNFLIMAVVALGCAVLAVVLIGGTYFLLDYEMTRIDDNSMVDTKMPILDKEGMKYFISRQRQRSELVVPVPKSPATVSPALKKKQ